jgi:hypothetical protein
MPHFLQDVSPSKLVTHACLPPTGQIEFEANSITTFTTVKKITRTMKTENMSDFDDVLAKIKKLKEELPWWSSGYGGGGSDIANKDQIKR